MCRYTLKIIKFPLENIVPSKELFKKIGYEQPKARRNEEGQQRTAKFKGGFGFGKVCDTAGTGWRVTLEQRSSCACAWAWLCDFGQVTLPLGASFYRMCGLD